MNGLESGETLRSVGLLTGVDAHSLPTLRHVTTACHHCLDPGCLVGCPTNAYEKDPETGIVRHLDDQCFGCQYCTMACPYEVPQYSESKGIVRKCDMCHDRLAEGEAPACVQACPNQAIRITNVAIESTKVRTDAGEFLSGSPSPTITRPTTIYRGERTHTDRVVGADSDFAKPQHAHFALIAMLVLTQFGVGLFALTVLLGCGGAFESSRSSSITFGVAVLVTHVGLLAALFHLGRPHLAFRSVLGWRHSWLSREAIAFGVFAPLAIGATAYALLPRLPLKSLLETPLQVAATLAGFAGVFCSAKIYQFTQREFWKGTRTGLKFGLTPFVLGSAGLLVISAVLKSSLTREFATGLCFVSVVKLAYEWWQVSQASQPSSSISQSARLIQRDLSAISRMRFLCGVLGGLCFPLLTLATSGELALGLAIASLALCLVGEFAERYLYFSAVVPLRMPGGIPS
ncbi:MAG: DmsC/YnfH family molybdoenzyme membrane anchor subunit [Lacipirellulaceae bacterium]